MAAAATQAAVAKMFKNIYLNRDLSNFSKRKCALGDRIKATPNLVGESLTFPINWGLNFGISTTLTATKPVAKGGKFDKWVLPSDAPSKLYGRVTIDIPSMMRSEKDIGSYMRLKAKTVTELLTNMKMQRRGNHLWSDVAGDLARISSVTGSNPITAITLTNYEDAIKFDGSSNQHLHFATTRTGGSLKVDGAATVWVYQVDKVTRYNASGNCVLTVSRIAGTGTTTEPAANDYIYNIDQYDAGPKGIPAWVPLTAPSATTFYGVDRTVEMEMLSGWRGTWEGTINDSIQRLVSIMTGYFDPEFSAVWLSPVRWYQLKLELEATRSLVIDDAKSLEFGTTVIRVITPKGAVMVMADAYCPIAGGWLLKHDEWEIHSTGDLIHMCDEDTPSGFLRLPDDDGLEARYRSLALYRCDTPGVQGCFPITQSA